ncbi:MAG: molybdopterin-dependent oxidoreductase [Sandaracinaceae bacterium]|nr:molybdopterin-dependent oxidoreductase [Sandaracinaceae bacterium]
MTETHHTFCRICESLCGLEVTTDAGRVVQIRPDKQHVATDGYGCVKGLKQHKMYDSPDRLKYPLKRVGGRFERISWEQALSEIGAKVQQLRGIHPDSIAMYVGTAAGFGVLHPVFAAGFMQGLGSGSMYASATQDCANKFAVSKQLYGFPFSLSFPDIDRTECLIIVGANPAISKWSFLQVSNPIKRLRAMEERGAKLYVVDPRRTETARVAGEYVGIRPNTDVFFYLSFLNELLAQGGVDRERVERFTKRFDKLVAIADGWTPERTETVTHVPAAKLREMVTAYRTAKGAALYCSTGVNMGTHGSLAFWLQEAINAISGNLDRRGGTLVGEGVFDFAAFGKRTRMFLSGHKGRVGEFEAVNDALPGGVLADEILTPGDRQVRALFVTGGNPLITMSNANRLRDAFTKLELLVCLDIQMSETAHLANYVLPCTSPLQRPDLPFIFPLLLGMQSRPYLQATSAVLPPEGEQRDEATIYTQLAQACGISLFRGKPLQMLLEASIRRQQRKHPELQPAIPQERILDLLLRASREGSFEALLAKTHGQERPEHRPGSFLGKRVIHEDGRMDLAPPSLITEAKKLSATFEREHAQRHELKLITKRAITTHNSWTHNIEDFVEGGTNYLYMHPDDAAARGLEAGDMVDVRTKTAAVRVPLQLLSELLPGVCALPHGWGHQHAKGMSVASRTRGVNVNVLAADGADQLERVSGMAHLTGFVVEVTKAAGPQDVESWSGLPEDRFHAAQLAL